MKPPPFDYVTAGSVAQAVELLNGGTDARVLAGGQSLMPLLNLRLASPEVLVDIGRIPELRSISVVDDTLVIGAGVTQTDVAVDPLVNEGWPILAEAIGHIGHLQIRNRGTLCGSLAHNDPLAELPAVALCLGAEVVVVSPSGERTVAVAELFAGPFMTSLKPGELVVAARFPALPSGTGCSIQEFASRTGDFATAGVVTRLVPTAVDDVDGADGVIGDASVVLFGLGPGPVRAAAIEQALIGATGSAPEGLLDHDVLARFVASLEPGDDVHASAATRRELASLLITRSIAEAQGRCR